MRPPGGSGVSRPIPARASARAVQHAGVEGAVAQHHRMVRGGLVEVAASGAPPFGQVKLVVVRAAEPGAGRRLRGLAADGLFYLRDGPDRRRADVDAEQLPHQREQVQVGVVEAGQHGTSPAIDHRVPGADDRLQVGPLRPQRRSYRC